MPRFLCWLMLVVLFARETSCGFINFNEYISMLPLNYFVKMYFNKNKSENLGSSSLPLALVEYNSSKEYTDYPKVNCKFRRVQASQKSARSEYMVNIIAINITNSKLGTKISSHCTNVTAVSLRAFHDIVTVPTQWATGNAFSYFKTINPNVMSAWSLYFERDIKRTAKICIYIFL
jgi:hypothetical protein